MMMLMMMLMIHHLAVQDFRAADSYSPVLRCNQADEPDFIAESNSCPGVEGQGQGQGQTSIPGSQEVAAIADTDDELDMDINEEKFNKIDSR